MLLSVIQKSLYPLLVDSPLNNLVYSPRCLSRWCRPQRSIFSLRHAGLRSAHLSRSSSSAAWSHYAIGSCKCDFPPGDDGTAARLGSVWFKRWDTKKWLRGPRLTAPRTWMVNRQMRSEAAGSECQPVSSAKASLHPNWPGDVRLSDSFCSGNVLWRHSARREHIRIKITSWCIFLCGFNKESAH